MDDHDIYRHHYALFQFLALFDQQAWGGPMDDRKAVYGAYFDTTYKPEEFARVMDQAARILAMPEFPALAIADSAGRVFDSPEECRLWFEKMLALTAQRVREENP